MKPAPRHLAGILLCCMILASIAHGFMPSLPAVIAGLFGWAAGLLLARTIGGIQRIQSLLMLAVGGAGLLWGLLASGSARFEQAIVASHPYELPEVIALPITTGLNEYLAWIEACTKN